MMGKEDRQHGSTRFEEPRQGARADEQAHAFEEPATLREPAAPLVPHRGPRASVSVIPLSPEQEARITTSRPATLQEAREATDALLREILEEGPADSYEPDLTGSSAQASPEDDWPSELHPLPFSEH